MPDPPSTFPEYLARVRAVARRITERVRKAADTTTGEEQPLPEWTEGTQPPRRAGRREPVVTSGEIHLFLFELDDYLRHLRDFIAGLGHSMYGRTGCAMPTLLAATDCPTCGFRHDLCLPDGALTVGRAYDYICPLRNTRVVLRPSWGGESVHHYPKGAVRLEVSEERPHPVRLPPVT